MSGALLVKGCQLRNTSFNILSYVSLSKLETVKPYPGVCETITFKPGEPVEAESMQTDRLIGDRPVLFALSTAILVSVSAVSGLGPTVASFY